MTFAKTTLALSTALLLVSAPVAFSAESGTTLGGGANTQMKGGANKTSSGMENGRSTTTTPSGTSAGMNSQNNKGPAQTGPLGGSHNGP